MLSPERPAWIVIGLALVSGGAWLLARSRSGSSGAVRRAVAGLGPRWGDREPAVVETQIVDAGKGPATTVYVVCESDSDRCALERQVPELATELRTKLVQQGASAAVVAGVRVCATSKAEIAREGGCREHVDDGS